MTSPSTAKSRPSPATGPIRAAWLRRTVAVLTATVAVLAGSGPVATPARAETLPVPLIGALEIAGRGFGHGHGMSQWGAYGAAARGLTWTKIAAFYYPGTRIGRYGNPTMRIRLSAAGTKGVTVVAAPGLRLDTGRADLVLPGTHRGKRIDRWRLVRSGTGQSLQWRTGSTWTTSGTYKATKATLGFASSSPVRVQLPSGTYRDYPHRVRSAVTGSGLTALNVTSLDSYLRGVVPNEMPASWPTEAVRAQAVVARTYALNQRTSGPWDLCDTTACQVYLGLADRTAAGALIRANTHPRSDAAIRATSGHVVTYAGQPAFTQFSASNGGHTAAGGVPYLTARPDPYDGLANESFNPHTWTLPSGRVRAALQAAYPAAGTVRALLLSRDGAGAWGGRVRTVTVVGSHGRVAVSGESLRSALGLRSTWFTITDADHLRRDVTGDGRPDLWGRTAAGVLYRQSLSGSTVSAPTRVGAGWNVMASVSAAGDLTGDGAGDLLARDAAGRLWTYPATRTGGLGTRRPAAGIPAGVDRLAGVGDVTSDGHADVVGVHRASGALWLYAGTGRGGFARARVIGRGWAGMDTLVGAGDTNRDGRADLWARHAATGTLYTYRLTAAGSVAGRAVKVGTGWNGMRDLVAVGDVTGGAADLLARDRSGRLWLYPGTGSGTFGLRRVVSGAHPALVLLR